MRASPSGIDRVLEPGGRERHVEPQPEQEPLARALLGGQLLERARRRLAALERVDVARQRRAGCVRRSSPSVETAPMPMPR